MSYSRVDHFVIDYNKKTKTFVGSGYVFKEMNLAEDKIELNTHLAGNPIDITIELEGEDGLNYKSYFKDKQQLISEGRFLNDDYDEMLFESHIPEKGLYVEAITTKVSDKVSNTIKTVRDANTHQIKGISQEIAQEISEEEYLKAVAQMKSNSQA